jgi:hypothetical protein
MMKKNDVKFGIVVSNLERKLEEEYLKKIVKMGEVGKVR